MKLTGLNVQLITAGTLIGTIRDDHGEALAGVQVQALTYTYQQGTRTLTSSGNDYRPAPVGGVYGP